MLLYRVSTAFDDVSSNGLTATSFLFLEIDMGKVKFSEGEWEVADGTKVGEQVLFVHIPTLSSKGKVVCRLTRVVDTHIPLSEQDIANSHLIAAAPSMYAMLECIDDLLGLLDEHAHSSIEIDCQQHEIRKILAKARGE